MPWKIVKSGNGMATVVNKDTGKPMSKKPIPVERARAQLRALYANVHDFDEKEFKSLKNTPLNILTSKIHKSFTTSADDLFLMGYIDQETRIDLSAIIGEVLHIFNQKAADMKSVDGTMGTTMINESDVDKMTEKEVSSTPTGIPAHGPGGLFSAPGIGGAQKRLRKKVKKGVVSGIQDFMESKKGGAGSGNFGHSGRPGKRGGSAPKSGDSSSLFEEIDETNAANFPGEGRPTVAVSTSISPEEEREWRTRAADRRALGGHDALNVLRRAITDITLGAKKVNGKRVLSKSESSEYDIISKAIQKTEPVTDKLSKEIDEILGRAKHSGGRNIIADKDVSRYEAIVREWRSLFVDLPDTPRVVRESRNYMGDMVKSSEKGGSGSGNFGHSGRPGHVGGSAGSGKSSEAPLVSPGERARRTKLTQSRSAVIEKPPSSPSKTSSSLGNKYTSKPISKRTASSLRRKISGMSDEDKKNLYGDLEKISGQTGREASRAKRIMAMLGVTDTVSKKPNKEVEHAKTAASPKTGEKKVYRKEGDGKHTADHYLVVENPQKSSSWHLRVRNTKGKLDGRLMGAAWAALTVGYRGNKYQGPDKDKALEKLSSLYHKVGRQTPSEKREADAKKKKEYYRKVPKNVRVALSTKEKNDEDGVAIYKQADGRYRWVTLSSNPFLDRDKEFVSLKSLENDVERADKEGDYGVLRWWHVPGADIGDCDFNMMHGKILVESGTFRDAAVGRCVKERANDLQVSLGFYHPINEPDENGVFHTIKRFERSLLPRGAASNLLTAVAVEGV